MRWTKASLESPITLNWHQREIWYPVDEDGELYDVFSEKRQHNRMMTVSMNTAFDPDAMTATDKNYFLDEAWAAYIRDRFGWNLAYLAQVDLVDKDGNIVWGLGKRVPLPASTYARTAAELRPWFRGFDDGPEVEHSAVYSFDLSPEEATRIASARLTAGYSDTDRK